MNDFERTLKKQEMAFAVISTMIFFLIFGMLTINEDRQEDIRTHEKTIEAERESFAVQEEAYTRKITYYKNKNRDLELTNEILADHIRLKQQKMEEW